MKNILEIETDAEFKELDEVLSKIRTGNIVCTLKQAIYKAKDNDYSFVDLREIVAKSQTIAQINNNYCYFTVRGLKRTEIRSLKNLFNIMIQHGTQCYRNKKANDYLLVVEVGKSELDKGWAYVLMGTQPVFVSGDGDADLTFVFTLESVLFTKEQVSSYDVEYEVARRKELDDDAYKYNNEDDDEVSSDIINNDEIMDAERYVNT